MATASQIDVDGIRATRAVVDLDAIAGNVRALRSALPAATQLMAVVKADGYGHGAALVAGAAVEAGSTLLGVATVGEGQELRAHGIRAPIMLLGSIDASEIPVACQSDLDITVAGDWLLSAVQQAARAADASSPVRVHLKVDTGLRRYGATVQEAIALAGRIASDPYLRLASIFTHFASADEPDEPFTQTQMQIFGQVINAVRDAGLRLPPLHAANSAGILTGQGTEYEIARAGIALYGAAPSSAVPLLPGMRAGILVESRVTHLFDLVPGDTVGYNRTFSVTAPMRGALVPIGYADGYRRALSGRAWVGIDGRRAPVLGRVSMDQIVVAVPDDSEVALGDPVTILGGDSRSGAPSIEEMAHLMGTNAYEVLVGISSRVPRVFMKNGRTVAVRAGGHASGWIQPNEQRKLG